MGLGFLHQRQATTHARTAQIAAAVLGLGAVAAVLIPGGGERAVPPIRVAEPTPVPGPSEEPARPAAGNAALIASSFGQIGNRPKPPETPTPPTGDEAPPPTPSEDSIKFLGAIIEPTRSMALVKVAERQRLLSPGESADSIKLVSVREDHIVIEDAGGQRRVDKLAKAGASVTNVANSGASGMPSAPGPGVNPALQMPNSHELARRGGALGRRSMVVPPGASPDAAQAEIDRLRADQANRPREYDAGDQTP